MSAKGVTAVHNPYSNLKLGPGVAPVPAMRGAGAQCVPGYGWGQLSQQHRSLRRHEAGRHPAQRRGRDPMAVAPYEALKMATVNGGKALGRKTGKIETGYAADLILVNFDAPNNFPCHDVIENLVYASHGCNVTMNMARGNVIYKDGEYRTIDLDRVRREVSEYALPLIFGK